MVPGILLHKHSTWCGKTVYYLLFAIELIYSYFAQALNYSVVDTGSAPYPSKKILGWEHFLEVHICVCIAVYVNSLKRDFNRKCNN